MAFCGFSAAVFDLIRHNRLVERLRKLVALVPGAQLFVQPVAHLAVIAFAQTEVAFHDHHHALLDVQRDPLPASQAVQVDAVHSALIDVEGDEGAEDESREPTRLSGAAGQQRPLLLRAERVHGDVG